MVPVCPVELFAIMVGVDGVAGTVINKGAILGGWGALFEETVEEVEGVDEGEEGIGNGEEEMGMAMGTFSKVEGFVAAEWEESETKGSD